MQAKSLANLQKLIISGIMSCRATCVCRVCRVS
jgi:hypothetical protein